MKTILAAYLMLCIKVFLLYSVLVWCTWQDGIQIIGYRLLSFQGHIRIEDELILGSASDSMTAPYVAILKWVNI